MKINSKNSILKEIIFVLKEFIHWDVKKDN